MSNYSDLAQRIAERSRQNHERFREIHRQSRAEAEEMREAARNGHAVIKQREKIQEVAGWRIAGFFPTPPPAVQRVLDEAEIEAGMTVLEPEAGAGHIAKPVRALGCDVTVIERNYHLCEILLAEGFAPIYADFLTWESEQRFDRILMNPPFEKLADIDHVLHANKFLAADGIQVAIMGAGAFFRSDRKAREFREWLEGRGTFEKLPSGTFDISERPTGVESYFVKIVR